MKISIFLEYNEKHNPLQTLVEPCTFESFVRKLSTKKNELQNSKTEIFSNSTKKLLFKSNVEQCVAFLHFDFMPSYIPKRIYYL